MNQQYVFEARIKILFENTKKLGLGKITLFVALRSIDFKKKKKNMLIAEFGIEVRLWQVLLLKKLNCKTGK